jgi:predicted secreted Zn-dependent protease
MSALGPAGTGGRYDGYTAWQIQWRYDYRASGNACAIAAATVSVRTSIKLPEWRNESTAPAELRAHWRRYLQALTEHENGHRDNGLAAAREIDRGLVALPAQANCNAMGAAANAFGQGILRKYNQRDLDYDSATRHGRTQGANWP